MAIYFFIIFIISFLVTLKSMNDFQLPKEISSIINKNKTIKGTILFFKNKIMHYSSMSSSGSSSGEKGK
ncbi:MAG: hypothetical protein QHH09_02245 [Microgenomates group bacterium]|nr:hypothetical protein [Microgenomates group bacterium]